MQITTLLLTALFFAPLGADRDHSDRFGADRSIAAASASAEKTPTVRSIVNKAKKLNDATTSAKITFSQSGGSHTGSGTLEYASGNRYRVTLPERTIVSNGTKVWTHFPGKNQVIINRAGGAGQMTPSDILQAFPGSYSTTLKGSDKVAGRAVWVVEATASGSKRAGDIANATLYIDKATHRFKRIKVTSPSIGSATITIKTAQYNLSIGSGRFTFTPPSGAKVIDLS